MSSKLLNGFVAEAEAVKASSTYTNQPVLTLTEQEQVIVNLLLKSLREARANKSTGEFELVCKLHDGGITHKYTKKYYLEK